MRPGGAVERSCAVCDERGMITGAGGSPSDLSKDVPRGKPRELCRCRTAPDLVE